MVRRSRAEARSAIVAAAAFCFRRDGFERATLEDVGARCGMSRQAVLYHFHSKDALLRAVTDPLLASVEAAVAGDPPARPTAQEQFAFLHRLLHILLAHPDAAFLVHRMSADTAVPEVCARVDRNIEALMVRLTGVERKRNRLARIQATAALAALAGAVTPRGEAFIETAPDKQAILSAAMRAGGASDEETAAAGDAFDAGRTRVA